LLSSPLYTVADVLRARILAIGRGYPDGNDFDWLRRDPGPGARPASSSPVHEAGIPHRTNRWSWPNPLSD
jgi:hypothetical protein